MVPSVCAARESSVQTLSAELSQFVSLASIRAFLLLVGNDSALINLIS